MARTTTAAAAIVQLWLLLRTENGGAEPVAARRVINASTAPLPPIRCDPHAKPVETCPDGQPCPASGLCPQETWWQLNATDCDANNNVGTCTGSTVQACEKECDALQSLNSSGCDAFNWPHKHFKGKGCYARKRPLAGLTLYVRQTGPQPPSPPSPPPGPAPTGGRYWWQFNQTDCLAGQEFGSCTAADIAGCKAQCLAKPGCGGFNWPHKHLKADTCFGNQGSFGSQPTLTLYALGPTKQIVPTPPPPEHELTPHALIDPDQDAKCLNGQAPTVALWLNNLTTSTSWVISIGGASPGLQYCFPASGCYMFSPFKPKGAPVPPPPPPPTPAATPLSGPTSGNCAVNPSFCQFNQAQITSCDMGLFLGDTTATVNATGVANGVNSTTLHLRGQKVLAAQLATLAKLGMAKATEILVTGIGHDGTMAIIHADSLHAQLLKLVPGLTKFGVLPVDGIHPKGIVSDAFGTGTQVPIESMLDLSPFPGAKFEWYSTSLQFLLNFTQGHVALHPDCLSANNAAPWKCLYANETLKYTKSPVFAIQQLSSVWDNQCVFNGQQLGNILQINCDTGAHNHYFRYAHMCTQYADKCPPEFIANWTTPLQQQSIQDIIDAGVPQRANSGGFFHSCYLGNLVPSRYNNSGQWQLLTINNVSMQQAVTNWWTALDNSTAGTQAQAQMQPVHIGGNFTHTHFDCVWNASSPLATTLATGLNSSTTGAPTVPSYVNHYFCNPSCAAFRTWY